MVQVMSPSERRRLFWSSVALSTIGVTGVFVSTFMIWIRDRYRHGNQLSGWDLVSTDVWRASRPVHGIRWTVTESWADVPAKTVATALPVVVIVGVALVCVIAMVVSHRAAVASGTVLVLCGIATTVIFFVNSSAWNDSVFERQGGLWGLVLGGVALVSGGVLAMCSQPAPADEPR